MSAISDIRHPLFWYRKKICRNANCHSDIGRVLILTSESIPISDIKKYFFSSAGFQPKTLLFSGKRISSQPLYWSINHWMSDIGYRIKDYSDIRYNVGLHSLQSDIVSFDFKLSPISLITDIGVSAYLWLCWCALLTFLTSVWICNDAAMQKSWFSGFFLFCNTIICHQPF